MRDYMIKRTSVYTLTIALKLISQYVELNQGSGTK